MIMELEINNKILKKKFFQEAYIVELDVKSGVFLKLIILNKFGRIWIMVVGGGVFVIYA